MQRRGRWRDEWRDDRRANRFIGRNSHWDFARNDGWGWDKAQRESNSNRVITVFVLNLPERLHWQGLWAAFAYHGEVIDAFIPNKTTNDGKRFGFVRFRYLGDARRAIERLNGFVLFGSRISVDLAKFNTRVSFWKKKPVVVMNKVSGRVNDLEKNNKAADPEKVDNVMGIGGECSHNDNGDDFIVGSIDPIKIEILRNCVLGWCKSFIKIDELAKEMQAAGLRGFSVMRIAGSIVMLMFEDSAMMELVQKEHWTTLDYWFSRKEVWSDKLEMNSRRIWLSCYGVPIHGWCRNTFQSIAERWGTFISTDDDTEDCKQFARGNIQIITNSVAKIDELVMIKIGDVKYQVRVV